MDEGNNWVNISWGPLAMTNPVTKAILGNYALAAGSPAIDYIPTSVAHPATDFFGNTRPDGGVANRFDVGAIEFEGSNPAPVLTSIAPSSGRRNSTVSVTLTGTHLTGTTAVTVSGTGVTVSGITVVGDTQVTATFTIATTAALSARNVSVATSGGTSNTVTFTVTAPTLASINPATGVRGTSVPVTLTGTGLTGATAVNVSGAGNGITVTNLSVVSDTQITATFVIAVTAPLSAGRNVTVTTPGGTHRRRVVRGDCSSGANPDHNRPQLGRAWHSGSGNTDRHEPDWGYRSDGIGYGSNRQRNHCGQRHSSHGDFHNYDRCCSLRQDRQSDNTGRKQQHRDLYCARGDACFDQPCFGPAQHNRSGNFDRN